MREVAQPMLKEILVVEFEEGKETVLKTQNGEGATYGELVKILYLKAKGENFVSLPVEVASCSNLTDLIYLKLRILSGLKSLRRLVLNDCLIVDNKLASLSFPSLIELSIRTAHFTKTKLQPLLKPKSLPALRAFGYFHLEEQDPSFSAWLKDSPILSIHMQDAATYPREQLHRPNGNILVDLYLPLLRAPALAAHFSIFSLLADDPLIAFPLLPAHFRVFDVSFVIRDDDAQNRPRASKDKSTTPADDLSLFLKLLRLHMTRSPTLRVLVLSRQFLDKRYKPANDELVKQCEAWKVKVIWEDEEASSSSHHPYRSLVSPAFLAYKGVY